MNNFQKCSLCVKLIGQLNRVNLPSSVPDDFGTDPLSTQPEAITQYDKQTIHVNVQYYANNEK